MFFDKIMLISCTQFFLEILYIILLNYNAEAAAGIVTVDD